MSNSFSCVGNLGRDAELKSVGDSKVLSFSIANSTGFGDNKKTIWLNASYWGKGGEAIEKFMRKGTSVFISGELSIRTWEKDGVEKFSTEIRVNAVDFAGGKKEEAAKEVPF